MEVRNVWQPWLKKRCDFVVRYIVPNRVSIVKTMEASGRFRSEVCFETVFLFFVVNVTIPISSITELTSETND